MNKRLRVVEGATFDGKEMPFEVEVTTENVFIPDDTSGMFPEDVRELLPARARKVMEARREDPAVLDRAFDLVKDPDDWKGPVDFRFSVNDMVRHGVTLSEILRSITYFTATTPFLEAAGDGWYTVSADGYRMGPAGDH